MSRRLWGIFITTVVALVLAGYNSYGNQQPAQPHRSQQQGTAATTRSITAETQDRNNHTPNPDHNDGDHCFQREQPNKNRDLVLTVTADEISNTNPPTAFLVDLNNGTVTSEKNIENVSTGSAQIRLHDAGTDRKNIQHLGPGPYVAVASIDTTMLRGNRGGMKTRPVILTFPYVTFLNDPSECPVLNAQSTAHP